MPALTPILALSSADATRLLRELSRHRVVTITDTTIEPAQLLVKTGLACLDQEHLVAVDPVRADRIIRAAVHEWLPDVLESEDRAS